MRVMRDGRRREINRESLASKTVRPHSAARPKTRRKHPRALAPQANAHGRRRRGDAPAPNLLGTMEDVAMKTLRMAGLTALAAMAASHCFAQELSWRPATDTPAFQRVSVSAPTSAAVTLSRPIPLGSTSDPNAGAPAVSLDRPTPLFRAKS